MYYGVNATEYYVMTLLYTNKQYIFAMNPIGFVFIHLNNLITFVYFTIQHSSLPTLYIKIQIESLKVGLCCYIVDDAGNKFIEIELESQQ